LVKTVGVVNRCHVKESDRSIACVILVLVGNIAGDFNIAYGGRLMLAGDNIVDATVVVAGERGGRGRRLALAKEVRDAVVAA
jgi:hypothetical protein